MGMLQRPANVQMGIIKPLEFLAAVCTNKKFARATTETFAMETTILSITSKMNPIHLTGWWTLLAQGILGTLMPRNSIAWIGQSRQVALSSESHTHHYGCMVAGCTLLDIDQIRSGAGVDAKARFQELVCIAAFTSHTA